jgi:hypothetical protein
MLALILGTAIQALAAMCGGSQMDIPPFPPPSPAADEEVVPHGPAFAVCDEVLHSLTQRGGGVIEDRQYSVSAQWGHLVRARLKSAGGSSDFPVACWSKPGEGAQIWIDAQGPQPPSR